MPTSKPSVAASARQVAWEVLQAVQAGSGWAEELLPRSLKNTNLSEPDTRLARELVFGVIKAQTYLDYVLQPHMKQTPTAPLRTLLRLGAYQLLRLDRIPDHAAVHATVDLAKAVFPERQVKFINAVLRGLLRRGQPVLPDPVQSPLRAAMVQYSLPEFLVRRWQARFGAEASGMMAAANQAPPVVVRVNLARTTREQVMAQFQAQGVACKSGLVPSALYLEHSPDPAQLPGFSEGWLYFQDEASQLIGYLIDPAADHVCLDMCSAPGGKTTHLAELAGCAAPIWAYDKNVSKLALVADNAKRLHHSQVSVLKVLPHAKALSADRVLVDAPCSGLGTLRRHAELRWRMTEADLVRLGKTQLAILQQAAEYVKPGGHLTYATCTTEPEENEQVVQAFLKSHPGFGLLPGPGRSGFPGPAFWSRDGFFRTFPKHSALAEDGSATVLDGMFAARLLRKR